MFPHFDQSEYAVALQNAYRQFPAKDSTLDIDFVNNRQRVAGLYNTALNGVTFTRSTTGTYFDANGTMQTAEINAPRFEYDPVSRRPLGLLIEESRSNSIANNTMQGAAVGSPGTIPTGWIVQSTASGITREIVGVGVENGISYIDIRAYGTPTASFGFQIAFSNVNTVAATLNQIWSLSCCVKLQAGSFSNTSAILDILETNGVTGTKTNTISLSPTSSVLSESRTTVTATLSSATITHIQPRIRLAMTLAEPVDITLRIGMPQLELGAFATSVIATSGTSVTRSADVPSMTGANFSSWYNQSQGTFFISADSFTNTVYKPIFSTNDGTINNRCYFDIDSGQIRVMSTVSGANQCLINLNVVSLNTKFNVVGAYATHDCAASADGGPSGTDTTATMPTVTQLLIGFDLSNIYCGHISRLTYYPKRLPNNLLQYLSRLTA